MPPGARGEAWRECPGLPATPAFLTRVGPAGARRRGVERSTSRRDIAASILYIIPSAVILAACDRRIQYRNGAAEAVLHAQDLLHLTGGPAGRDQGGIAPATEAGGRAGLQGRP